MLVQFTYRFDMFLVLSMLGLKAQGFYSIAVLLAEKLSHIPQSVTVVLFPQALFALERRRQRADAARDAHLALPRSGRRGGPVPPVSRPLLLLFYGTEFLPALKAFQILIPGIVTLSVGRILSSDLSGRDHRIYHTVATAIAFASNVGLCLVWIPRYGIEGAAWASTVAYTLQSAIMLAFFTRLSGCGLAETVVIRREDLALYGGLVRKLLRRGGS